MFTIVRRIAATGVCSLLFSTVLFADSNSDITQELNELKSLVNKLNSVVGAQQRRINELEKVNVGRDISTPTVPTSTNVTSSVMPKMTFNPDIGVVADILASSTQSAEDEEGNDRLSVREIELNIGHDVDPFTRLDAVIAFSDFEEASLEEAYLSYWDLPFAMKGRFGKFKPLVGKSSSMHRDGLDTVDQPLVVQEYLGVEGYSKAGIEFTYPLPLNFDRYTSDISLGVVEGGVGEEGTLFGETRRRPTYYGHIKNFWEISDVSNLELGASYLIGSADEDSSNESKALGFDLTYLHYLSSINRLKLQGEVYLQDRSAGTLEAEDFDRSPVGTYGLIDYRLSNQWGIGARYDYVEPVDLGGEITEDATKSYSGYLTFYQSEFARFRFQYQHLDLTDGSDDERFFLQATAAIGYHKHKLN